MDFSVWVTRLYVQEGEVSTVEVTRRMSEERDLQPHGNNNNHPMTMSAEDKERRLQRWKDKLGPRDDSETAVMTASGANAIKVRRDRPSRSNEPESVVMVLIFLNFPLNETTKKLTKEKKNTIRYLSSSLFPTKFQESWRSLCDSRQVLWSRTVIFKERFFPPFICCVFFIFQISAISVFFRRAYNAVWSTERAIVRLT